MDANRFRGTCYRAAKDSRRANHRVPSHGPGAHRSRPISQRHLTEEIAGWRNRNISFGRPWPGLMSLAPAYPTHPR
jgi:hypothetical protein